MSGNFDLWMKLYGEEHAAEANKIDSQGVFYASTPDDFKELLKILDEEGVQLEP